MKKKSLYERVQENHYMTLTYTGPCSFGDHYDFECSCGKTNEIYGSATDVMEHALAVAEDILLQSIKPGNKS